MRRNGVDQPSSRFPPPMRRLPLLLLLVLVLAPFAGATSVVPPTFPELVDEADAIYRGRVAAIQARRVALPAGQGDVIKTFVTFAIERVLKGAERSEITLEFLGGTVGDESLVVSGMPTFNLGAREIVFVQKNGVQFCPLVAVMHGRYRVQRDAGTGRDHMVRDNGAPLLSTSEVELPLTGLPAPVRTARAAVPLTQALTAESFEADIRAEVARRSAAPPANLN